MSDISHTERTIISALREVTEEAIRSELIKLNESLLAVGQEIFKVEVGGPPNFSVKIINLER